MADENDRDLVNGLKANDARCQKLLVDAYAGRLLAVVMQGGISREDGREVVNDTFYKVVQNINRFDLTRGTKFSTWITKIAINTARDKYKQIKGQLICQSTNDRADRGLQDNEALWQAPHPQGSEFGLLSQKILKQALEDLSDTDQEILRGRACGYEHKEIGLWVNKTPNAVKVAYLRAKERLKQKYIGILEELEDKKAATAVKAFLDIEELNEETAN